MKMSKVRFDAQVREGNKPMPIKRSRQSIEKVLCVFMENLSFYVSLLVGTYCVAVLPEIYRFHAQMNAEGKPFEYRELLFVLVGFFLSGGAYFAMPLLFGKFVEKNATDAKFRLESREQRRERLLNYLHGMMYYMISLVAGMLLTKGSDLRPKLYGGKFDGSAVGKSWPADVPTALRYLSLIHI